MQHQLDDTNSLVMDTDLLIGLLGKQTAKRLKYLRCKARNARTFRAPPPDYRTDYDRGRHPALKDDPEYIARRRANAKALYERNKQDPEWVAWKRAYDAACPAVAADHTMQVKERHYEKVGEDVEQLQTSYKQFHPAWSW